MGDMHDSLRHALVLCYHAYLLVWNNLATATLASTPYHVVTKQILARNLKRARRSKKRKEAPIKTPLV